MKKLNQKIKVKRDYQEISPAELGEMASRRDAARGRESELSPAELGEIASRKDRNNAS